VRNWTCSLDGRNKNCLHTFCGETSYEVTLGRPTRRREDNLKIDIGEVGCRNVNLTGLTYSQIQ